MYVRNVHLPPPFPFLNKYGTGSNQLSCTTLEIYTVRQLSVVSEYWILTGETWAPRVDSDYNTGLINHNAALKVIVMYAAFLFTLLH